MIKQFHRLVNLSNVLCSIYLFNQLLLHFFKDFSPFSSQIAIYSFSEYLLTCFHAIFTDRLISLSESSSYPAELFIEFLEASWFIWRRPSPLQLTGNKLYCVRVLARGSNLWLDLLDKACSYLTQKLLISTKWTQTNLLEFEHVSLNIFSEL